MRTLQGSAGAARFAAALSAAPIVPDVCTPSPSFSPPDLRATAVGLAAELALSPKAIELSVRVLANPSQPIAVQRQLHRAMDEDRLDALLRPLDARGKARVLACTAPGASAYLTHPHMCGAWLAPRVFPVVLGLRLGLPVVPPGARCAGCHAVLDDVGDHSLTCMKRGARHAPHNAIRDFLWSRSHKALLEPLKEHMCFPGHQERMDVVVRRGLDGKQLLLDVALTFALRPDAIRNPGPGVAATRYEETKWSSYRRLIDPATQLFAPIVFDTFGGMGDQARRPLGRIATGCARRAGVPVHEGRGEFFGAMNRTVLSAVAELVLSCVS